MSAAYDTKKVTASVALASAKTVKPLLIENSSLASSMWCRENETGAIQCDLEDDIEDSQVPSKGQINFDIEDILNKDHYGDLDREYWDNQWNEQYVYKFPENDPKN